MCEKSDGGELLSCRAYMHERATLKLMLGSSSCRVEPCQVMQQCSRLILSPYDLWLYFIFIHLFLVLLLSPYYIMRVILGVVSLGYFLFSGCLGCSFISLAFFFFFFLFFCSHIISFPLSIPLVLSLDCW